VLIEKPILKDDSNTIHVFVYMDNEQNYLC